MQVCLQPESVCVPSRGDAVYTRATCVEGLSTFDIPHLSWTGRSPPTLVVALRYGRRCVARPQIRGARAASLRSVHPVVSSSPMGCLGLLAAPHDRSTAATA